MTVFISLEEGEEQKCLFYGERISPILSNFPSKRKILSTNLYDSHLQSGNQNSKKKALQHPLCSSLTTTPGSWKSAIFKPRRIQSSISYKYLPHLPPCTFSPSPLSSTTLCLVLLSSMDPLGLFFLRSPMLLLALLPYYILPEYPPASFSRLRIGPFGFPIFRCQSRWIEES